MKNWSKNCIKQAIFQIYIVQSQNMYLKKNEEKNKLKSNKNRGRSIIIVIPMNAMNGWGRKVHTKLGIEAVPSSWTFEKLVRYSFMHTEFRTSSFWAIPLQETADLIQAQSSLLTTDTVVDSINWTFLPCSTSVRDTVSLSASYIARTQSNNLCSNEAETKRRDLHLSKVLHSLKKSCSWSERLRRWRFDYAVGTIWKWENGVYKDIYLCLLR